MEMGERLDVLMARKPDTGKGMDMDTRIPTPAAFMKQGMV